MSNRAESWFMGVIAIAGAVAGCGPEVQTYVGASGTGGSGTGGATQGTSGTSTTGGGTGTSSGGPVPVTDWVHTWGGNGEDIVRDVAIDASGNIYAVGDTTSFDFSPDVMLLKYDAAGTLLWAKTWGQGGLNNDCLGTGVAISPDGGVYVVGQSVADSYTGDADVLVLRYNADGILEFAKIWGYSTYLLGATDIAIAADGSLYVVGWSPSLFPPQCASPCIGAQLLKLDASAEPVWVRAWVHDQGSVATSVAVAPDGKVIVSGAAENSAGYSHYMLTAFDEAGTLLWDRTDKSTSVYTTEGTLALDAQGGAYVAFPGSDHSTVKFYVHVHAFDPSGQPLWARRWHAPGVEVGQDSLYVPHAVVTGGSVLVTAWSYKTWGSPYSMVVAFGTDGSDVGAATWSGPGNEQLEAIAPAAGGRLVLAGSGNTIAGSFAPAAPAFETWTPQGGLPAPFVQELIGGVATAVGTEGSPAATIDAPPSGGGDALVLQQLSPFGPGP